MFMFGSAFAAEPASGVGPAGPKSHGSMSPQQPDLGGPSEVSGDGIHNPDQADPDEFNRMGNVPDTAPEPGYMPDSETGKK